MATVVSNSGLKAIRQKSFTDIRHTHTHTHTHPYEY
jgi:hypothetical protein